MIKCRNEAERDRARRLAEQVARIRFVVFARVAGERELEGCYECPCEAHAAARTLRRTERVAAWVETVGGC